MTSQANIDWFLFSLILLGAMMAHISVNTLNEYYDFKSGLDLKTEKTPFSGGSGALPANPEVAPYTLAAGLLSLGITIIIGIYFIQVVGIQILPIGLIGILLVITYTQWLNCSPILCLLAPGLGTGTLMIVGTHLLLTGEYMLFPLLVSFVPFFLSNNLLLLNQYPDIQADKSVGRKTFPIAFGLKHSNTVYALFTVVAYGSILYFISMNILPNLALIALTPIVFSVLALWGAHSFLPEKNITPSYLWANVVPAIVTPILLGVSIIYG